MRNQSAFRDVVGRRFAGAARRLDPRPSESRPSSPSIRGNAAAAPPAFPAAADVRRFKSPQPPGHSNERDQSLFTSAPTDCGKPWPHEDGLNEPSPLHCFAEQRTLWALGAKFALVLLWFVVSLSSQAAVREVGAIGLTVGDLDRVLPFYTNTLPFKLKGIATASGREQDELLGLSGSRTRSAELKLGDEHITLTEHFTNKGRPIPLDSRSFDHWFQHIAIVVSDMDKAYDRLRRAKVRHISTAPQTLPAWNKDAGGIQAFYFRDPEDHVLEIIWFPPGKGDPKWQHSTTKPAPGSPLFLGVDHTAIVVSDTDKSLEFYRDTLGMRVAGGAENYGVEQEHLNQVFGARLRITALRAERGPGIEFLEYITPPGGRPLPADAKANDLVFWNTELVADEVPRLTAQLRERKVCFVSSLAGSHSQIVRDPDGHALYLREARASLTAK